MPTLLVNSRMPAELAGRIANGVAGRRGAAIRPRGRAARTLLRAVTAVVMVTTVILGVGGVRAQARDRSAAQHALDARSAHLRAAVQMHAATTADATLVARLEGLVARLATEAGPDLVAEPFRNALDATLRRPMIHVRGPSASLADPAKIAATAKASVKDAFVVCLLVPPASRAEDAVLARAKGAYGRLLALEDATPNVRRLDDLERGMPFLLPTFDARIAGARSRAELASLESAFDKAPIVDAKRAANSELLLAVFDEPGDGAGPTEIDGEQSHDVRVVLAEIATGTPLLRLRRHVDPSWASTSARIQYASGIDACALAYDVRTAVTR